MTAALGLLITCPGAADRRKPIWVGDAPIDTAKEYTTALGAGPSCLCYLDEFDTTDTKSGSNGFGRPRPAALRIVGRLAFIIIRRRKSLPRHHGPKSCTSNEIFESSCIGDARM